MNKKTILLAGVVVLAGWNATLNAASSPLNDQRVNTIKRYVVDLGTANAGDITQLFVNGGVLYTDSKGKMDPTCFFNSFLPKVANANTTLGGIYGNPILAGQYLARFHFIYIKKDGAKGGGEFADRFVFAKGSSKLQEVDMYELLN